MNNCKSVKRAIKETYNKNRYILVKELFELFAKYKISSKELEDIYEFIEEKKILVLRKELLDKVEDAFFKRRQIDQKKRAKRKKKVKEHLGKEIVISVSGIDEALVTEKFMVSRLGMEIGREEYLDNLYINNKKDINYALSKKMIIKKLFENKEDGSEYFYFKENECDITVKLENDKYILLSGSKLSEQVENSLRIGLQSLRESCKYMQGCKNVLGEDLVFDNASAACSFALGHSSIAKDGLYNNGSVLLRNKDGLTVKMFLARRQDV